MTEAAKKARAEYMRAWRSKNREKCKQYAVNQWERRAERMAQEQHESEAKSNDEFLIFPGWGPSNRPPKHPASLFTESVSCVRVGRCAASNAGAKRS